MWATAKTAGVSDTADKPMRRTRIFNLWRLLFDDWTQARPRHE
jgi:hypothetical protein